MRQLGENDIARRLCGRARTLTEIGGHFIMTGIIVQTELLTNGIVLRMVLTSISQGRIFLYLVKPLAALTLPCSNGCKSSKGRWHPGALTIAVHPRWVIVSDEYVVCLRRLGALVPESVPMALSWGHLSGLLLAPVLPILSPSMRVKLCSSPPHLMNNGLCQNTVCLAACGVY